MSPGDSRIPAAVDEPIQLASYDPQWPESFAAESARIAAELPAGIVIEHIGSTAVPGLLSKPIIDLMVGVRLQHELARVRLALSALGYEDMGEAGVPGRLYFRRRPASSPSYNVALVEQGGPIWTPNLALRDYLRAHPDAAEAYAAAKQAAFNSGARSLLAYSAHKSVVLARLVRQALAAQ